MRLDVPLDVHAHEGGKLHEARIDFAQAARIAQRARVAIRFCSNHDIGLEVASSFTLVGLTRQSIGPAINVIERGCAGWLVCAMTAAATSVATQGWHTATTWRARADHFEKRDQMLDIIVEAEAAGRERRVARIVPVGDVDVMLGQQRLDGVAQQRREMPRQRRHQQDAWLRRVDRLGKPAAACRTA